MARTGRPRTTTTVLVRSTLTDKPYPSNKSQTSVSLRNLTVVGLLIQLDRRQQVVSRASRRGAADGFRREESPAHNGPGADSKAYLTPALLRRCSAHCGPPLADRLLRSLAKKAEQEARPPETAPLPEVVPPPDDGILFDF